MGIRGLTAALAVGLLALAPHAEAGPKKKPATAPEPPKPWAKDVTPENQKEALEYYKKGNEFFVQSDYKDALEQYEAALKLWQHPSIQYNKAVCEINLDKPLDAFEDLTAALRYGDAPFTPELYQQGLTYMKTLQGQVAEVEISSQQPEVEIRIDGQLVQLDSEGKAKKRVLAGEHEIVAKKPGYVTETIPVQPVGGEPQPKFVAIKLNVVPPRVVVTRRFTRWKPWATLGIGGVVAAASLPLFLKAHSDLDSADKLGNDCNPCSAPNNPIPGHSQIKANQATLYNHAKLEENIGLGLAIGGGAVAATGFLLILLNGPKESYVSPTMSGDRVGVSISGRW